MLTLRCTTPVRGSFGEFIDQAALDYILSQDYPEIESQRTDIPFDDGAGEVAPEFGEFETEWQAFCRWIFDPECMDEETEGYDGHMDRFAAACQEDWTDKAHMMGMKPWDMW